MTVVYYAVPEGELGRFSQDIAKDFDVISDDISVLFVANRVVLILKRDMKTKDEYNFRLEQMETIERILSQRASAIRIAIVSEYLHPCFARSIFSFLSKVEDLRLDLPYYRYYTTQIFGQAINPDSLYALRRNLHIMDSDGQSLRAEIVSVLRLAHYGLPVRVDLRLNPYRLLELVVLGKNRTKTMGHFHRLAKVFTAARTLDIVIAFLSRCLAFRARRGAFEKSLPGRLVIEGSKSFLPGAFLRCILFARKSTFPPDVVFCIVLHMLNESRTRPSTLKLDWKSHIATIKSRRRICQ